MQYGFYFNGRRCTGCKSCVAACKDYHDLTADISYRQVYEYVGGSWNKNAQGFWENNVFAYYVSLSCNHCEEPVCTHVCPTGAMHKSENGIVSVNIKRCIGCGYCAMSCPYRAPKVNRELGHSSKCNFCEERLEEGKKPICVEACPLRALEFGDVEELRAKYGDCCDIAPLPDPSATHPNLVINPSLHAVAFDSENGHVANIREIV